MMVCINLQTAVIWGQLSKCEKIGNWFPNVVRHYSCNDKAAYQVVAAFASLLLVCQTVIAAILYRYRGEFIDESNAYSEDAVSMSPKGGRL